MLLINIYSTKAQFYSPDHTASKIILIKPFRSTSGIKSWQSSSVTAILKTTCEDKTAKGRTYG